MSDRAATKTVIEFDDQTVRQFMVASIFWAIVAMLVGVVIATQLAFWQINLNTPYLTFGRLRPLHTNAAIFAFVGNMMFAGIYYSLQRLVKARLASKVLSGLHSWGWQAIIVAGPSRCRSGSREGRNTRNSSGRSTSPWRSSGCSLPSISSGPSRAATSLRSM